MITVVANTTIESTQLLQKETEKFKMFRLERLLIIRVFEGLRVYLYMSFI